MASLSVTVAVPKPGETLGGVSWVPSRLATNTRLADAEPGKRPSATRITKLRMIQLMVFLPRIGSDAGGHLIRSRPSIQGGTRSGPAGPTLEEAMSIRAVPLNRRPWTHAPAATEHPSQGELEV